MTLNFDDDSFPFDDADAGTDTISGTNLHTYYWSRSSFGWSVDDEVAVTIESDLLPVLSIEAVNDDIPYGLGDFAAAGVAEFRVTRSNVPAGETHATSLRYSTMLKEKADRGGTAFDAGKATDTLKHFAVDEDGSSNPICTIPFVLQESDDYLVSGTESEATVNVSGPGTTCNGGT